jgi:hypothetical protein
MSHARSNLLCVLSSNYCGTEFFVHYTRSTRAYVVGKTLVGMRAEDVIRAVDYL